MREHFDLMNQQLFFINLKRYLPFVLLFSSLIFTNGCVTSYLVKEAIGEEAEINIRCFRSDSGDFVVNWTETPIGNESAIYISSPLNECENIYCYLDAQADQNNQITEKFQTISPITYHDKQSRIAKLRELQLKQCDVLISVGVISEGEFSGISIIADQRVIAEKLFPMPEDKPSDSRMWPGAAIGGPIADAIIIGGAPVWWAIFETEKQLIPDVITISFDFENGERKETFLTYEEAHEILTKQYPHVYEDFYGLFAQKEATVRFWARAALAKLNVSFREERFGLKERNLEFTSINDEQSTWGFDLRDGSPRKCSLMNPIGTTGYIRFSHYY